LSSERFRSAGSAVALYAAYFLSACHDRSGEAKRDPAVLDKMEFAAARRVGLESAVDAMQRGDLKRLQMLATWARGRAQVALFEPDDLKSLDLAIACLDGSLARDARVAAFNEIKSGKLVKPARDVCFAEAE